MIELNSKLKIRKQKLSEILYKRIVPPSLQTIQTTLPKASLDAEIKEEQNFIKEAQGKTRGKLDLNTCRKKTESQKRNAGYAPLHITLRKTSQISIVSTVNSQATLKNTATKGKQIIYSIGNGKCSLNRKKPMKKDLKGK